MSLYASDIELKITESKEIHTVVEAVANLVPDGLKATAASGVSCATIPETALYRNWKIIYHEIINL